jgi:hypothetical protein
MSNEPTPIRPVGAAILDAAIGVDCARCADHIDAGERVVQALGIPGLLCIDCGLNALQMRNVADDQQDPDATQAIDFFEVLRQEYQVRTAIGWPTPPATLVVDPEEGPVWRVGVEDAEDDTCLGRGALNGDQLEVTLYQPYDLTEVG